MSKSSKFETLKNLGDAGLRWTPRVDPHGHGFAAAAASVGPYLFRYVGWAPTFKALARTCKSADIVGSPILSLFQHMFAYETGAKWVGWSVGMVRSVTGTKCNLVQEWDWCEVCGVDLHGRDSRQCVRRSNGGICENCEYTCRSNPQGVPRWCWDVTLRAIDKSAVRPGDILCLQCLPLVPGATGYQITKVRTLGNSM